MPLPPAVDKGYTRAYDPGENRTRVWDKNNQFIGYEPSDTEKLGTLAGPVDSQAPPIAPPGFTKDANGHVTLGTVAQDLIPVATQALVPELPGLSPAMRVGAKMGISTAAGTALDQLMSMLQGGDKPLLNSATMAGSNALTGIGLPELLNVGPTMNPLTRRSISSATPSVTESTGSSSGTSIGTSTGTTEGTTTSATKGINDITITGMTKNLNHSDAVKLGFQPSDQVTETIRIDPETKKFVKAYTVVKNVPREGQYQTNTTVDQSGTSEYDRLSHAIFGSSTEGTSQSQRQGTTTGQREGTREGTTTITPGIRTTDSEYKPSGVLGQILQLMKGVGSKQYNLRGNGQPNLNSLQTALLGLGINLNKNSDQTK